MWSLLASVSSEIEADIINGFLEEAKIPTQKKYPGDLKASYGIINGVEVWVPSDSLEQAQELLTTLPPNLEGSIPSVEEYGKKLSPHDINSYKLSASWLPKLVLFSFILVLSILIIYWVLTGGDSY